jgi:hypothetical protein
MPEYQSARHWARATAVVVAALLSVSASAGAQPPPPNQPPVAPEPIDPDASAAFDWSVPTATRLVGGRGVPGALPMTRM